MNMRDTDSMLFDWENSDPTHRLLEMYFKGSLFCNETDTLEIGSKQRNIIVMNDDA